MPLSKLAVNVACVAFVSMLSGCGLFGGAGPGLGSIGKSGPTVPPVYGPYEVGDIVKINLGERERRIQTSIEVPPERGTVAVAIRAHGSNFDSAANQMATAFSDLKKIGANSGCGFKIGHYEVPDSSDNVKWKSAGVAEIHADVTGLDPEARLQRANSCFKPLREYILSRPKYDTGTNEGFEVKQTSGIGPMEVWSVESVDKHRDQLVTQANERLKSVQKADAKMWDHADLQCTSGGVIQVASSSSHAVTLQLEMLCVASPAETSSGPGKTREIAK